MQAESGSKKIFDEQFFIFTVVKYYQQQKH